MSLKLAVELCTEIYNKTAIRGWYPALTGGTLYKEGERKDIDIAFYTNRQRAPTKLQLIQELVLIPGFTFERVMPNWIWKGHYHDNRIPVDLFFPEDDKETAFSQLLQLAGFSVDPVEQFCETFDIEYGWSPNHGYGR